MGRNYVFSLDYIVYCGVGDKTISHIAKKTSLQSVSLDNYSLFSTCQRGKTAVVIGLGYTSRKTSLELTIVYSLVCLQVGTFRIRLEAT